MVDRFDVRNLLTDRRRFQKQAAVVRLRKEDVEMELLCDRERYRLLREPESESEDEDDLEMLQGNRFLD